MTKSFRIVMVVADDLNHEPRIVRALIEEQGVSLEGIVEVPLNGNLKRPMRFVSSFLFLLGPVLVAQKAALLALNRARAACGAMSSVANVARAHGIPYAPFDRINGDPAHAWISARKPDLILSHQPQIIRKRLLDLPPHGVVNLHPGRLPFFRGPAPVFWALASEEAHTGLTVHFMNEKLDDGPIVCQRLVKVQPGDGYRRTSARMAAVVPALLKKALDVIGNGGPYRPNIAAEGSYFTHLTAREALLFRLPGGRKRLWARQTGKRRTDQGCVTDFPSFEAPITCPDPETT
jgi:methionyl-tRNA formyltransferase